MGPEHKDPVVAQRFRTGKGSFACSVHMDDSQKSINKASDSSKMLASSGNRSHGEGVNNSVAIKVPYDYCEDQKRTVNSCEIFSYSTW